MIKYLIPLALLTASCEPRTCTVEPGQPLPIGSCVIGANPGDTGGQCLPTPIGTGSGIAVIDTCNNDDLACVAGNCYDCGKSGLPCCGSQTSAAAGSCFPGQGTCGMAQGNEWFTCVGGTSTPPPGDCSPGQSPNFFVVTLSAICMPTLESFCAPDQPSAEAFVNATFGNLPHGPVGTDPNSVEPQPAYACGEGPSCTVSDGTMATTFYAFTHDQVVTCEHNLDPNCSSWVDSPNDSCPM